MFSVVCPSLASSETDGWMSLSVCFIDNKSLDLMDLVLCLKQTSPLLIHHYYLRCKNTPGILPEGHLASFFQLCQLSRKPQTVLSLRRKQSAAQIQRLWFESSLLAPILVSSRKLLFWGKRPPTCYGRYVPYAGCFTSLCVERFESE